MAPMTATSTPGTRLCRARGTMMTTRAGQADHQGGAVDLTVQDALHGQADVLDQGVAVDGEAEQLRDLAHEHHQRDAVEVADPDGLGQQVGHEPQVQEPAQHQGGTHQEGQQPGQGHGPLRVTGGQWQDGGGDDGRERRVGPQHQDPRRADQRVGQQRHDRGVQAGLRWQSRRLRVAHAGRDEQCREHHAGHQVRTQPGPLVPPGHDHAREPSFEP